MIRLVALAGYLTLGVRTGVSFVQHGLTGYLVARLPPGQQCIANQDDEQALAAYLDALAQAQVMDRQAVRAAAAEEFDLETIVAAITLTLEANRTVCESHG